MLSNIGPHVDRIYFSYSEVPWTYNRNARSVYRNPTKLSIVDQSEYREKIHVITGVWDTEEDQRNACVTKARAEGFNLMLCVDTDEFYLDADYPAMLAEIGRRPDCLAFQARYITFWKNLNSVIIGRNGLTDTGHALFAIRCDQGIVHTDRRSVNTTIMHTLDGPCYHLGYVMSDGDMMRKLKTWGHSADFNHDRWYRVKWLGWTLHSRNLHPLYSTLWPRAEYFKGKLPQALVDFVSPENHFVPPSKRDRLFELVENCQAELKRALRPYWRRLRYGPK
jgi:hypothetical protein